MGNQINDVYHVYTNGMSKSLWFHDETDFTMGMNLVPSCGIAADVTIYCFCLMSNHVHFILKGSEGRCIRFIREYKRLSSKKLALRHFTESPLAGAEIGIKAITNVDYLKKAIAYVMRNPVAAKLRIMPWEYRWSSSYVYFADSSFRLGSFCTLRDLAYFDKEKLFQTRLKLPDEYILCRDGIIFPGSYVDYRAVEKIYNSPRQLLYYLSSGNDMEEELESGILKKSRYSDPELIASMEEICSELFSGKKYSSLRIEDRFRMAKELKKRYGAGPKQLSRVTTLEYDLLKAIL